MLYGTVTAAVRGMTATESTETLTIYQLTLITSFFALLLPFGVRRFRPGTDAGLILFNGLSNAIGQYWWTQSLHLAPASAVTPFFYLSLVWAVLIGFVVWGDVPTIGLADRLRRRGRLGAVPAVAGVAARLEPDPTRLNQARRCCLFGLIFSENRLPLFGIMPWARRFRTISLQHRLSHM